MICRLIRSGLILLMLATGCATMNPTPDPRNSRPADFKVVYDWQEGSLPPPYHYEYTITLAPDGQGQIVMVPDYAFSNPPTWTETFTVTPAQLDQFYRLVVDKGLFTQRWQAQSDPPVGGSSDSLTITAHGQQITIPAFVVSTQAAAAEDITTALRALAPQDLLDKLNTQREQYQQEHSN
jgi:hypothetical protein